MIDVVRLALGPGMERVSVTIRPEWLQSPDRMVYELALSQYNAGLAHDALTIRGLVQTHGLDPAIVPDPADESILNRADAIIAQAVASFRITHLKAVASQLIWAANTGEVDDAEYSKLTELLATPVGIHTDELFGFNDVVGEAVAAVRSKQAGVRGCSTGLTELDRITGGATPGAVWVIAGRPGMGKTSLAMQIAQNAAAVGVNTGRPSCFISIEMPRGELAIRAICSATGLDLARAMQGRMMALDVKIFEDGASRLANLPLYINDTPGITVSGIRRVIRNITKKAATPEFVVIDYLQLMRADGKHGNREQEISSITRQLKELAREENTCIIALSQLNREVEKQSNKRPGLADLRESGAIEQDADAVIFVYREEYYDVKTPLKGVTELIFGKHRNGPTGTIAVGFDAQYTRFRDLSAADRLAAGLPPQ